MASARSARGRVAVQHPVRVDAGETERDETGPRRRDRACWQAASLATSIAAAPSTIWLEFPAVTTPSGMNAGCSEASFSSDVSRRGALVHREQHGGAGRADLDGHDLALEPALVDRGDRAPVRLERVRVELARATGPTPWRSPPPRCPAARSASARRSSRSSPTSPRRRGSSPSARATCDSTPAATTTSRCPAWIAAAALNAACIDEPHWRSTVVAADGLGPAGDERGDPADVQRLLADLRHAAHLHVLDLTGIEVERGRRAR